MKISKLAPLWIKEPLLIYWHEKKLLPLKIAMQHAICDYADIKYPNTGKRINIYMKSHNVIYTYLEKNYSNIFQKFAYEEGIYVEHAPIWVFWWQGEDSCPDIVKLCIKSIKKHAGNHPVIVINERNYKDYVSLPEYILSKQKAGIISLTHFSDILRMNLIADHGGYWMDATIFCTRDISEDCFQYPIYTGKNPQERYENISHWRWTGYAISGYKNNTFFSMAKDIFNAYWEQQNVLIDYFLIDYVLKLIYDNVPDVKKVIDNLPNNNENQKSLQVYLNEIYTKETLNRLMTDSTWLYKVTWKSNYQIEKNGKTTVYGYLIEHV